MLSIPSAQQKAKSTQRRTALYGIAGTAKTFGRLLAKTISSTSFLCVRRMETLKGIVMIRRTFRLWVMLTSLPHTGTYCYRQR